jgi:hypothetical protein
MMQVRNLYKQGMKQPQERARRLWENETTERLNLILMGKGDR